MNEAQENHYDTATLADEQLSYAESLFFAIVTLLEQTMEGMLAERGMGMALSHCEHAATLARLGAMEAGGFADQFRDQANALSTTCDAGTVATPIDATLASAGAPGEADQ